MKWDKPKSTLSQEALDLLEELRPEDATPPPKKDWIEDGKAVTYDPC